MEIIDIYIFIENTNRNFIEKFISNYLKDAKSEDAYFEYPKYKGEVLFETENFEEMFEFITEGQFKKYTFYLQCSNWVEGKGGIIQTYDDNSVCLGLSVFPEYLDKYKKIMMQDFGEYNVFVQYYEAPPLESNLVRKRLEDKKKRSGVPPRE